MFHMTTWHWLWSVEVTLTALLATDWRLQADVSSRDILVEAAPTTALTHQIGAPSHNTNHQKSTRYTDFW